MFAFFACIHVPSTPIMQNVIDLHQNRIVVMYACSQVVSENVVLQKKFFILWLPTHGLQNLQHGASCMDSVKIWLNGTSKYKYTPFELCFFEQEQAI